MSGYNSLAYAQQLDHEDELAPYRKKFRIPQRDGREQIYFLGNSLGLQPRAAGEEIDKVLEQWAAHGVEGFFSGEHCWMDYHDQLTAPLSKVVGALPHEVVIMNQLTVNLHLMMASFYRPAGAKRKVLCEAKAFPSDQYMLETYLIHLGLDPADIIIEVTPARHTTYIATSEILAAIESHKEELALVLWGGVNYYSGQVFDMEAIARTAHDAGVLVGFDLAHAAGNVPLYLHDWQVDFACWCSYKYLNSGPGGVGGAFIHERHHADTSLKRLAGWWGYDRDTRFRMDKGFIPDAGAAGWQVSTPTITSYALHKAALDIFEEAGLQKILEKGRRLSNYLYGLMKGYQDNGKIDLLTPENENERGCQLSIYIEQDGDKLFDYLREHEVFADWREPGVIRVAPVPLYNSFEEVWRFANIFEQALQRINYDHNTQS